MGTVIHGISRVPLSSMCCNAAGVLRALADIVEAHDKEPRFAENLKAIKEELDELNRRIVTQKINDELLAACTTCDEAITELLRFTAYDSRILVWTQLRAAGHLAKRAAENADKAKGGA